MEKMIAWLAENIKRMALKTPRFFQVWQTIGIVCMAVGFIPDALEWLDITAPEPVNKYIALAVKVAGGVMWFMAKIPFDSEDPKLNTDVKELKKLPFTKGTNPPS